MRGEVGNPVSVFIANAISRVSSSASALKQDAIRLPRVAHGSIPHNASISILSVSWDRSRLRRSSIPPQNTIPHVCRNWSAIPQKSGRVRVGFFTSYSEKDPRFGRRDIFSFPSGSCAQPSSLLFSQSPYFSHARPTPIRIGDSAHSGFFYNSYRRVR